LPVAYLVNTYPRASHSFIRREIHALEASGLVVHRLAMRSDRGTLVDPADLEEDARTEHLLRPGAVARLARAVLGAAVRGPGRFVAAVRLAWACGARANARALHLVYLAEACAVADRCRALGVRHLHAHFGTNPATVAMLASQLGGPPYSFTVHGPEEFDAAVALSLGRKVAGAAFAVTVSSFGRSQLMRWAATADWERIHVVHCGIEPDRFAPAPPPPDSPAPTLVAIGRFAEQKGHPLLIEALALARAAVPGLRLVLVGDGPLRPVLEDAVDRLGLADAVDFAGWLDEAGVRTRLEQAHALVLPSFAEGLPVVAMEAMATGRPVVGTWIAGLPELVRPDETGWLVPAGDATALAAAMIEAAKAPYDRRDAMGQAARARVVARHDIARSAAQLLALFGAAARDGTDG